MVVTAIVEEHKQGSVGGMRRAVKKEHLNGTTGKTKVVPGELTGKSVDRKDRVLYVKAGVRPSKMASLPGAGEVRRWQHIMALTLTCCIASYVKRLNCSCAVNICYLVGSTNHLKERWKFFYYLPAVTWENHKFILTNFNSHSVLFAKKVY